MSSPKKNLPQRLLFLFGMMATVIQVVTSGQIYEKCGDRIECFEEELVKYVDELDDKPSVGLLGNFFTIERNGRKQRAIPGKEGLIERCVRFLSSHELKMQILEESTARSIIESTSEARTKKLRRMILPLLLLLKLKAAIIVPAVLSVIALAAFNGLGAGLVAMAIAGATGLKTLLDSHSNSNKLTYEVVPQISHWGRAGIEAAGMPAGYHTIPN